MKCLCHSEQEYATCCEPYHLGGKPPTPLALMRSRYSAYAMGNVDYILATTHPNNPDAALPLAQRCTQIKAFCQNTQFVGLEIVESTNQTVTFRALLLQKGSDVSFTEKSLFEQIDGQWLYVKALEKGPDRG